MLAVALRKVSTDTGHFIEDYWALTKPYMDDLNRKTPSRYYPPCKSLDAPIGRNQDNWTLSDCISDKSVDDTILYVQSFTSALPKIDQFILHALMNNRSISSISKELGISSANLKSHVRSLGEKYLKR